MPFISGPFRLTICLLTLALGSACTPRFNREGLLTGAAGAPTGASSKALIQDLASQGGAATPGMTASFRVSRVTIGGDFQRVKTATASGKSVKAGASAPQ